MKPRIFFAVPCYRNVDIWWSVCGTQMLCALHNAGIQMEQNMVVGDSLVPRPRNRLVRDFLKTKCTHLLFIDTDQTFHANTALALLETEHELVGAAVPKKAINWERVVAMAKAGKSISEIRRLSSDVVANYAFAGGQEIAAVNGCYPVDAVGTGLMMVARSVFTRIAERFHDDIWYRSDHPDDMGEVLHAFFSGAVDKESRRFLSEDYEFCRMARAVGVQPYIDPRIVVGHVGTYEYTGSIDAVLEPTIIEEK